MIGVYEGVKIADKPQVFHKDEVHAYAKSLNNYLADIFNKINNEFYPLADYLTLTNGSWIELEFNSEWRSAVKVKDNWESVDSILEYIADWLTVNSEYIIVDKYLFKLESGFSRKLPLMVEYLTEVNVEGWEFREGEGFKRGVLILQGDSISAFKYHITKHDWVYDYNTIIRAVRRAYLSGITTVKQAKRENWGAINTRYMEKKHKRAYDLLGQVFGSFYSETKIKEYALHVEKFDWDKGANYYYHSSSCLWSSWRKGAQKFSADSRGYALLLKDSDGTPQGRALLYGDETGGVVFNFYGKLNPTTTTTLLSNMGLTKFKECGKVKQSRVMNISSKSIYLNGKGLLYGDAMSIQKSHKANNNE